MPPWQAFNLPLFFGNQQSEGAAVSTCMDGIVQGTLFSGTMRMDIVVSEEDRYRILAEKLPWLELGGVANEHRAKKVDLDNGRPLNLRLHLGALICQSMNGWTDRQTEEMVRLHAGVRLMCNLEQSSQTIDRTNIEGFRNQIGKDGVEALSRIVVNAAKDAGFTDTSLCSADTTVQEAPIAYPTEVGHMKNIAGKVYQLGSRIKKGLKQKLKNALCQAQRVYTKIRLFTRGKSEKVVEKKKKLGQQLQRIVSKMERMVRQEVSELGAISQMKYHQMELYRKILSQIRHWIRHGVHPKGKLVSLWLQDVRAITRDKAGKATEFGRRWVITRLHKGYVIGMVCRRLGGGSDTSLMPQILEHFDRILGEMPQLVVYDRGGDGPTNHRALMKNGITNGIFRKGRQSQPGLGRNTALRARRERALSEATIATLKASRYGFNRPRARSTDACILKGHAAILGANLTHFARDYGWAVD